MITKYFSNKAFFKILYSNEDDTIQEINYICSDDLGNLYIEKHTDNKIEIKQLEEI